MIFLRWRSALILVLVILQFGQNASAAISCTNLFPPKSQLHLSTRFSSLADLERFAPQIDTFFSDFSLQKGTRGRDSLEITNIPEVDLASVRLKTEAQDLIFDFSSMELQSEPGFIITDVRTDGIGTALLITFSAGKKTIVLQFQRHGFSYLSAQTTLQGVSANLHSMLIEPIAVDVPH